jgi:predicted kinase
MDGYTMSEAATSKPYDLQVSQSDFPEDEEIEEWTDSRQGPILNILIGLPKCGKSTFAEKYGLQGFESRPYSRKLNYNNATREINIINGFWSRRKLKKSIKNSESIIFDSENLSERERIKILKLFSDDYQKVAVVWELSDEELLNRGCSQFEIEKKGKLYERPSRRESFDEFIYIF